MAEVKRINGYDIKDATARAAVEALRSELCERMDETQAANEQWMANHNNYLTPQMFGAVADGVTNDSAAFKAMIDSTDRNKGAVFFIPAGTYAVDLTSNTKEGHWNAPISLYKRHNVKMIFAPGAKLVAMTYNVSLLPSALISLNQCSNIKIEGGEFIGWRSAWDTSDASSKPQAGIMISCCQYVWIDGVDSHDHINGAICVCGANPTVSGEDATYSEYILIENSKAYDTYYHGAYIEGGKHVVFENVTAYGATLAPYACSIDIEGLSDDSGNHYDNIDIVCKGCYFGTSFKPSVSIHKNNGVALYDCFIENGLTVQTGSDYLIDGCEIHGYITQTTEPNFKNVVIQNSTISAYTALSSKTNDASSCEWLFKNNTYYFEAFDGNNVMIQCGVGHVDIKFIGNVFNVASVPTATKTETFSLRSGVYMDGNTFNVGTAENNVDISRFWNQQGSGESVLLNNRFFIYSTTTGQYYIYSSADVSTTMIGNVFKEYGSTANNRVFAAAGGKLVCKDNVFDLPKSTYAVHDTAADTNIYKGNLFVGGQPTRITNTANDVRDKIDNSVAGAPYFLEKGKLLGNVTGTHSAGEMQITVDQTEVDASIEKYKIVECSGVLCSVYPFVDGSGVKGICILGTAPTITYVPYVGVRKETHINIVLNFVGGVWKVVGNASIQNQQQIFGPTGEIQYTPLCNTEIKGIM